MEEASGHGEAGADVSPLLLSQRPAEEDLELAGRARETANDHFRAEPLGQDIQSANLGQPHPGLAVAPSDRIALDDP